MNDIKSKYADSRNGVAPIGVIQIRDRDGNIIREAHNMVVIDGQRILLRLFLNNLIGEDNAMSVGSTDMKFTDINTAASKNASGENASDLRLYLGYEVNPEMTVESMGIDDMPTGNDVRHCIESYMVKYNMDASGVCVTLTAKLSGSDIHAFNEIWLACPTTENQELLFSRALIDPVFLGADANYSIAYTLYF